MRSTVVIPPQEKRRNKASLLLAIVFGSVIVYLAMLPSIRSWEKTSQHWPQEHKQPLLTQEIQADERVEDPAVAHSAGIKRGAMDLGGAMVSYLGNLDGFLSSVVPSARNVLLLHGAKYNAETWEKLGTLRILDGAGYRVAAVNLPTTESDPPRDELLEKICNKLGMGEDNPAVIVSPSMSGSFAIPLLLRKSTIFKGFVAVAPPTALSHKGEDFDNIHDVPTLIVYGEKDGMGKKTSDVLRWIPGSEVLMIAGASHAAYLDDPDRFHAILLDFLQRSAHL